MCIRDSPRDDPREDVGVGVVQCGLKASRNLSEDVAGLCLGERATPSDVVEQILGRSWTFQYYQEAVLLLEMVDQVNYTVDVRQPLKHRDLGRNQATVYLYNQRILKTWFHVQLLL